MAFDGILNISKKNDVDLIVMGSHGASGYKEMFVGSNAEKVVRHSEVPVLIIKEEQGDFKVNNFVFASDFSDEIKAPFQKVVNFANSFGAKLHLLTINTPNNFKSSSVSQKIMNDFIADFKVDNYQTHIYNETNVEKGILNFANSIDADLIGISTHGRKGLAHFFNGSISEDFGKPRSSFCGYFQNIILLIYTKIRFVTMQTCIFFDLNKTKKSQQC